MGHADGNAGMDPVSSIDSVDFSGLTLDEGVRIVRSLQRGIRRWQESCGISPDIAGPYIQHGGYCHCCRSQTIFRSDDPWLRDFYACTSCGSIPRQRNLFRTLDELDRRWTKRSIHESSPGDTLFSRLARKYTSSQFVDGVDLGAKLPRGGTCQNLERLTFPDNTFEIFITQDVMEHVFDVPKALNETLRVLKPGGLHVFTTPRFRHLPKTVQRAACNDGQIEYLKEPVYHGNPVGDGRALVTFDWGNDLEALFESWTGTKVETYDTVDRQKGIDGAYFEAFVMRKPNA